MKRDLWMFGACLWLSGFAMGMSIAYMLPR